MMKMDKILTILVMGCCFSPSSPALAGGEPEIMLAAIPGTETHIQDGQVIARGRVIFRDAHTRVRLWLESKKNGEELGCYVLTGRNNSDHRLRVRSSLAGSKPDNQNGNGVVSQISDKQISFDIVADGQQRIEPDEYIMVVHAAGL